ncbi:MAG: DUF2510 domain-containing protein [Ilumatobacteraceae bacterium]|jgi:hypothetical protein
MKEFSSVSVYNSEHAKLADKLNGLSADGWTVVSIVSTGSEVVAYLSRDAANATSPTISVANITPTPVPASNQNGWASVTTSTPAVTQAVTTPTVPADWYKDPAGRYEFRYWDGNKWTEHVSRGGVRFTDPPTP